MTRSGEWFIGYAGRVRVGPVRLSFTSALHGSPAGITTQEWRVLDGSEPERAESGDLRWYSRRLGVQGSWKPAERTSPRVLHESSAGRVTWDCMVPGGQARVRVGGAELEGHGYAECLSMSGDLAPLGFRELLWGRFTGSSNRLVWLAWIGAEPLSLVLRNGEEVPGASVPDPEVGAVIAGEHRLFVESPRVIRSAIADRSLPWALRLGVPAWLRGIREEKWIASARLEDGSGPSEEGWAIYERVTWP